jgi:cytochrome P450
MARFDAAAAQEFAARATAPAKPWVRWGAGHLLPRVALRGMARRGDLQARLMDAASNGQDLSSLFDEIRAAGPLPTTRLGRVTVSHSVVREVLSSKDFRTIRFKTNLPILDRLTAWSARDVVHPIEPPSLLAVDPPEHTRYRRLVTRVFTMRAVERLRERTEQIADELLDEIASGDARRPVELVDAYCSLLPVTVICEILGVAPSERGRVLALGSASAPSLDLGLRWRAFRDVEDALEQFDAWLGEHIEYLRHHPGDDLLSQLVAAHDDGVGLTQKELKATAGLVLAAGFETTVNLLGSGIALLAGHPDQLDLLRERPELWTNAVEEVLRLDPPVLLTGRVAACDTEIAGTRVPAGARVSTILAGANRDPEVFTDPTAFDVTRANARDHLAFGAGRHHCLGASLARMEGEVGLRRLFERFPGLRPLPGATRRSTRILRGFERLPVVIG